MPVLNAPSGPTHEIPGTTFTSLATPTLGPTETSVWRVSIAAGTEPTPHSLTRGEVFLVLHGTASVRIGETVKPANPGDVIIVPADTANRVVERGNEHTRGNLLHAGRRTGADR